MAEREQNSELFDEIPWEEIPKQETLVAWMNKEAASMEEIKVRRKDEAALLDVFKKNPGQETFMPLYRSYEPMIRSAAYRNMAGSPLPESAHMALAAQSFMDSIRTWKPGMAPFHHFAYNTIFNKGKRLNLKYQNIGYIPESRATKYQVFNNAVSLLKEQLGREPSSHEIADDLAWSVKDVETMRKEVKKDLVLDEGLSEGTSLFRSNATVQAARDIMYSLTPQHQVVLEHLMEFNGKQLKLKPSGGPDLAHLSKATNLPVPKIRSALKTITRKLKSYRGDLPGSGAE